MVWYGMVWYGMEWYGMVSLLIGVSREVNCSVSKHGATTLVTTAEISGRVKTA